MDSSKQILSQSFTLKMTKPNPNAGLNPKHRIRQHTEERSEDHQNQMQAGDTP